MSKRPGNVKKKMRRFKKAQFNKNRIVRCRYCGRVLTYDTATVDHLDSLFNGGNSDNDNFGIACVRCNCDKDDMSEGDYIAIKKEFKNRAFYEQEKIMEAARKKDSPFLSIDKILGGIK